MPELIISLIIIGVQSVVFGFATQSIIENKGYHENWFWWGFFFGIIALVVASAKPQVYDYTTYSSKSADQHLAAGGWKCTCGKVHASYVSSCSCGKDKRDVLYPQNTKKLEETKKQAKIMDEMGKVSAIKEYKALMDDGIITQEEFEAKKKQLLDL